MRNVHDDAPVLMKTRWALSYLRGPLTGAEIARLMADRRRLPTSARQPGQRRRSRPATQPRSWWRSPASAARAQRCRPACRILLPATAAPAPSSTGRWSWASRSCTSSTPSWRSISGAPTPIWRRSRTTARSRSGARRRAAPISKQRLAASHRRRREIRRAARARRCAPPLTRPGARRCSRISTRRAGERVRLRRVQGELEAR